MNLPNNTLTITTFIFSYFPLFYGFYALRAHNFNPLSPISQGVCFF